MDENKRAKLIEIKYEIRGCGVCVNGRFGPLQDFGTCTLHAYRHLKHSGEERELSIHRNGECPNFTPDPDTVVHLGRFEEFIQP